MGSEWLDTRLGDICEIRRGSSPRPIVEYLSDIEGMPWVKIADATESDSRFIRKTNQFIRHEGVDRSVIVHKGDLILSNSGTAGLPRFMEITACIHDGWQVLRKLNGITSNYLYYSLIYIRSKLLHNAYDSTMKNLTLDMVRDAIIKLPPLPEQELIAGLLTSIDDKIDLNRQINTTLESMAQALFKSWFVDFDPVIDNALAAGNEIPDELAARAARREALRQQTNKTTGASDAASSEQALPETGLSDQRLPSEIQQLFPDRFVLTDEMGWVPEGWEVKPLNQFGQIVCGKTPSKSKPEFFGSDIPFIKIPDMHDNVFVVDPNEKLSNQGANSQVKKMLPRGSVCVSCIATVGKVVITVEPSQTNQQINSIVPHDGFLTEYLYFYMQTLEKHFHDLASGGSATLNMNTTTFGKVEILSPDSKVLDFFHRYVERSFSQIELRMKQSLTLTQLRDSLLPKLLSGQITIPGAGQQLAGVL